MILESFYHIFFCRNPFLTFDVCQLRLKSCYESLCFSKLLNQSYMYKFVFKSYD